MIAGDFVYTYAPKYLGKVPEDMGSREISLILAAGTALIFASFAGIPYLSSWLVMPTGFANYYAFRCVLDHVAPPVWDYFAFVGCDEQNLGRFVDGVGELLMVLCVSFLLRNIGVSWWFAYELMSTVKGLRVLVVILGAMVMWTILFPEEWKTGVITFTGGKLLLIHSYLAAQFMRGFDRSISLFRMGAEFLNDCDSWVIQKRNSRLPEREFYKYNSLQKPREIRLLKVSRRRLFTAFECSLLHVTLDDKIQYEAISYTWNGETPTIGMLVDGKILKVTPAVHDMLTYRHTFLGSRCFWIDAACINQDDMDERGQQVTLMKDIYKKASRVVVFLGPVAKAKEANLAREMIHYLVAQKHLHSATGDDFYNSATKNSTPGWEPLAQLFGHRWFSRVWVIQEVAVADTVDVMYGRTCTSWESFAAASDILTDSRILGPAQTTNSNKTEPDAKLPTTTDKVINVANLAMMVNLRNSVLSNKLPMRLSDRPILLGEMLFCGMSFKSTNPRDRVYGVMGLITEKLPDSLKPDYTKPVDKLYIDTMRYVIPQQTTGRFNHPLYLAGIGFPRTAEMEKAKLPSWVADWNSSQNTPRIAVGSTGRMGRVPEWATQLQNSSTPRILKVRAVEIDRIKSITTLPFNVTSVTLDRSNQTLLKDWMDWIDDAWDVSQQSSREVYPSEALLTKAFWAMLTGPTEDMYPAFSAANCAANWAFLRSMTDGKLDLGAMRMGEAEVLAMGARLSAMTYRMGGRCGLKRFCVSNGGRLGLVPLLIKESDMVCYIEGLSVPFVFREIVTGFGGQGRVALVGTCILDDTTSEAERDNLPWSTYFLE